MVELYSQTKRTKPILVEIGYKEKVTYVLAKYKRR